MIALASPNHGLLLHQVTTSLEAAGLAEAHHWCLSLPAGARVPRDIYEPALAILYLHCELHRGRWAISQPVLTPASQLPTGPRFMQLSQSVEWRFKRGQTTADKLSIDTTRASRKAYHSSTSTTSKVHCGSIFWYSTGGRAAWSIDRVWLSAIPRGEMHSNAPESGGLSD